MKKFISVLTAATLLLAFTPVRQTIALAAEAPTVKVDGKDYEIQGPDDDIFSGDSYILVINLSSVDEVKFDGNGGSYGSIAVFGDGTLTLSDITVENEYESALIIQTSPDGSPTVNIGDNVTLKSRSSGICVKKYEQAVNQLSLFSDMDYYGDEPPIDPFELNLEGDNISITAGQYGIFTDFDEYYSADPSSNQINITGECSITIDCDNGIDNQYAGISALFTDVNVDGGSVDVTVKADGESSSGTGIYVAGGNYTHSDGTANITVNSTGEDSSSYGIWVESGDYIQNGGSSVIDVESSSYSCGIEISDGDYIQENDAEISIVASCRNDDEHAITTGIDQIKYDDSAYKFIIDGPLEIKTEGGKSPSAVYSDLEIEIADGYIVEEGGRVTRVKWVYDGETYYSYFFADLEETEYDADEFEEKFSYGGYSSYVKIVREKTEESPKKHGHSYELEEISGGSYGIHEVEEKPIFIDIIGHWAEDDIIDVYEDGYMDGISDNMFFPDSPASRLTFTDSLYRMAGSPEVDGVSPFADCSEADVIWAAENGIVAGFEDGTFRPYEGITREQFAVVVYNYMKYLGREFPT